MKINSIVKIIISIFILLLLQTKPTEASLVDIEGTNDNTVSAGCWAIPKAPNLIFPTNNYVATSQSGWYLNPYMDWSDSWYCPDKSISYQYESYNDSNLTILAYRSSLLGNSMIPALGTPNGTYYWRVRAYDGENWSDWSSVLLLTVDNTLPSLLSLRSTLNMDTPVIEKEYLQSRETNEPITVIEDNIELPEVPITLNPLQEEERSCEENIIPPVESIIEPIEEDTPEELVVVKPVQEVVPIPNPVITEETNAQEEEPPQPPIEEPIIPEETEVIEEIEDNQNTEEEIVNLNTQDQNESETANN